MTIKDKLYVRLMYVYNLFFAKSLYRKNLYKWFLKNWDNTFLVNYPLNNDSVVIDVGWYVGSFSDKILSKYNCNIYIFEPVKKYYDLLKEKYKNNKKVFILPFGLGNKNDKLSINIDGERSSIYTSKENEEQIVIKPFHEVFSEQEIEKIDLMSINIEWWEYDLINNIIGNKIIDKIAFLQIQFHDFVDYAEDKRKKAIEEIKKTHKVHYSYPFVWESFTKK